MHRRGMLVGIVGICTIGVAGCLDADERDAFQIDRQNGGCREATLVTDTIELGGRATPSASSVVWRVELERGEALDLRLASETDADSDIEWPSLVVLDPSDEPLVEVDQASHGVYRAVAELGGYYTVRLENPQFISASRWSVELTWYSDPSCV